ncbi:MAG TPA: TetR/AcrR family transcriptional regulator [Mycobacteriales bacterium]|nr:TetR/AcrR family transcriptional regulator [Mycobacteriales bacterium]
MELAKGAADPPRSKRRARGSLSGDEIVDIAERIVGEHGVAELSMSLVAKELNSGVTSIYWYFRSKDDLLQALADRVARQLYRGLPPIGDESWDFELMEYFLAYRDLIERVPVYRELITFRSELLFTRSIVAKTMFRRIEAGLELLVDAGLTPVQARQAYMSCSHYTSGFVILNHGHRRWTAGQDRGEQGGADEEHARRRARQLDNTEFRFGLNLIVNGICEEFGLTRGRRRPAASRHRGRAR